MRLLSAVGVFVFGSSSVWSISLDDLPRHLSAAKKSALKIDISDEDQERQQDGGDLRMSRRLLETLEKKCPGSLDIVVSQDTTGSFSRENYESIKDKLYDALASVASIYENSRYGLVRFEDIPIPTLGREEDTCYERMTTLGDLANFQSEFDALASVFGGGYDYPESQYSALMATSYDPAFDWRKDGKTAKIILTITDSVPHLIGKGLEYDLAPNPGTFPPQCDKHDYPSFDQIKAGLVTLGAIPAFVARERSTGPYPDPIPVYREFVDVVMNGVGSVQSTESFNSLEDQILQAIDEAIDAWCGQIDETCVTEDVLFVRDLSSSTFEDISSMSEYVTEYVNSSNEESRFALVSHSDKPVEPFGFEVSLDYCYWLHQDLTSDKTTFLEAYTSADSDHRSGGDWPENQLDAIIQGVRAVDFQQGKAKCNCVVVLSDSFYHEAGDFSDGSAYTPGLPNQCEKSDYPSMLQVGQQIAWHNVACIKIATAESVRPFWEEFKEELEGYGFEGTIEIDILPDPVKRKLSASFATQQRTDLRHRQSRI